MLICHQDTIVTWFYLSYSGVKPPDLQKPDISSFTDKSEDLSMVKGSTPNRLRSQRWMVLVWKSPRDDLQIGRARRQSYVQCCEVQRYTSIC